GPDGLAPAAPRRDTRRARRLRMVVRRHAVLPAAVHHVARRSGDALPGRSGSVVRDRGALAVLWPMERRGLWRCGNNVVAQRSRVVRAERGQRRRGVPLRDREQVRLACRSRRRGEPRHDGRLHRRRQRVVQALIAGQPRYNYFGGAFAASSPALAAASPARWVWPLSSVAFWTFCLLAA